MSDTESQPSTSQSEASGLQHLDDPAHSDTGSDTSYKLESVDQCILTKDKFRKMDRPQRAVLLDGALVEIIFRRKRIIAAPRRLLLASFSFAQWHLADTSVSVLNIPSVLDQEAFLHVLNYFTNVCRTKKFYSLPCPDNVRFAAAIYQVCQLMGAGCFAHGLSTSIQSKMRPDTVSLNDLRGVLGRLKNTCALFNTIASVWTVSLANSEISESEDFLQWLNTVPGFENALIKTDPRDLKKRTTELYPGEFRITPQQARALCKSRF